MLHNPASNENTLGLIVVQIERVYTSIFYVYSISSKNVVNLISCIRHVQRGIIVKYPVYDMVKGV